MPDIYLSSHCVTNEFGALDGIYKLMAYCVYPTDRQKRDTMTMVQNIEALHSLKYKFFDTESIRADLAGLEDPDKKEEFWKDAETFFKEHHREDIDIPAIAKQITPLQFAESFHTSLIRVASGSMELPDNIERFLLYAPTPDLVREEREQARRAIYTSCMILLYLMRLQRSEPLKGGISLTKAIRLIELRKPPHIYHNSTDIQKAWNIHKKSAHLFFGMCLSMMAFENISDLKEKCKEDGFLSPFISPPCLGLTLVFAKAIQEWLLSIKLSKHSEKRRLVSRKELWTIPDRYKLFPYPLKQCIDGFEPLDSETIRRLR